MRNLRPQDHPEGKEANIFLELGAGATPPNGGTNLKPRGQSREPSFLSLFRYGLGQGSPLLNTCSKLSAFDYVFPVFVLDCGEPRQATQREAKASATECCGRANAFNIKQLVQFGKKHVVYVTACSTIYALALYFVHRNGSPLQQHGQIIRACSTKRKLPELSVPS